MPIIEVGFDPHPFEKTLIEQTKEHIRSRLAGEEIHRLKIVLKKRPGSEIALQFVGDPDGVDKAKRLLGVY
jgi:hypothetical protein